MITYQGNASRLYNRFRADLGIADSEATILDVLVRLFSALNTKAAAVLTQPSYTQRNQNNRKSVSIAAQIGHPDIWTEYIALCRTNREPVSRILRLSPHPISLSDIQRHPRLEQRTQPLVKALTSLEMNDLFAVPVVNQQLDLSMVVFAGHDLLLGPTYRHLMAQVAADIVLRLHSVAMSKAATAQTAQHLQLTARQLEIASWIVAGKTDWEIGEILQISPKTVNFHVENIKRTYGVKSRNQFVAAIVHEGGLSPI